MRDMADSVNVLSLPGGFDLYGGYDDGHWPDADAIAQRFPGKTVVRITVDPFDDEGDMLDVENGDATPDQAPPWVVRRRADGHGGPLVYFAEANRGAVVFAFLAAGVPLPGLFVAAVPGVGPYLQRPTDVGHQYAQGAGGAYDISTVIDYLPGIDPAPPIPEGAWQMSALEYVKGSDGLDLPSVLYVGSDNHVHQLVYNAATTPKWTDYDLTHAAGAPDVRTGG